MLTRAVIVLVKKVAGKKKNTSPSPPAEPLCPPLLESGDYLLIFDLHIFKFLLIAYSDFLSGFRVIKSLHLKLKTVAASCAVFVLCD